MKNFPWKGIAIGCAIMTVLVIARCAVTVGFVRYYGGSRWMDKLIEDPWFYIGMVSAAVCACSLMVLADKDQKKSKKK